MLGMLEKSNVGCRYGNHLWNQASKNVKNRTSMLHYILIHVSIKECSMYR